MQLEDWLDDLCVRFIINLPSEELESVERICFQVEEAQWFYEDFIRPLDPALPSLPLRAFSLRIFQHCPLFSQWSAQHYTTAFAEFLAYKQRVPVRGAVMLNDDMDEVVLVKGWKKGANWSFPRGKINKDENDLDCAIREVYEETGFDIRAAGLVRQEKDMKYIEVTMREQHMRLYVFRGVPKNTRFEPRTRKEISKIDWYKLTDLPTLKKHKHHDSNGDITTINANKFYMVAPFLNPLKKWIAQQRKKDFQQDHLAATSNFDDVPTEDEEARPSLPHATSFGPSDLPEVSVSRPVPHIDDPSTYLKSLLKMDAPPSQSAPVASKAAPSVDIAKSSALLALLRGDSTPELRAGPNTPLEQIAFDVKVPRSPQRPHPRPPPFSAMPPPPHFGVPLSDTVDRPRPHPHHKFAVPPRSTMSAPQQAASSAPSGAHAVEARSLMPPQPQTQPLTVQYVEETDVKLLQGRTGGQQAPAGPPSSALPKLTNHTKALLGVFKSQSPSRSLPAATTMPQASHPAYAVRPDSMRPLRSSFYTVRDSTKLVNTPEPQLVSSTVSHAPATVGPQPASRHQASLLDLFRQLPIEEDTPAPRAGQVAADIKPVELAANPVVQPDQSKEQILSLLRQSHVPEGRSSSKRRSGRTLEEGDTSATISGPMNLPQFEGIKGSRRGSEELKRSPVPASRTLYDPKHPQPIKILARPDDHRRSPARSPRPVGSPRAPRVIPTAASPKDAAPQKEPSKPFQPQILRRPQTAGTAFGGNLGRPSSPTVVPSQPGHTEDLTTQSGGITLDVHIQSTPKKPTPEAHRQTLLSLFGKHAQMPASPAVSTSSAQDVISPLTASQVISPIENEPISTRSRMGSLASVAGAGVLPSVEKRHTAAGDKAFLLGYLSRIASQDG